MSEFGHISASGRDKYGPFFMDAWGVGPFYIRVNGKRYSFEDSAMFGPVLLNKDGSVSARQPVSERHPFWLGYQMWANGGRRTRWGGKACIYEKAKPGTYSRDPQTGKRNFISGPPFGLEYLGYVEVPPTEEA